MMLYSNAMSQNQDERIIFHSSERVEWKGDKFNKYLFCRECGDFWILELHQLKSGHRDILLISKGCPHLKWVNKVKNPNKVIAEVLTAGGKVYLIPRT